MPSFRTSVPVRFGDVDHAGIVFYPQFFVYFHQAFEDFFGASGMPYHDVIGKQKVGFPTVHVEVDYTAPLRYGDALEVELGTVRVGDKSATFRYAGTRRSDGRPVCTAFVTAACVRMDSFEAMRFPEPIRELFGRIAVEAKKLDSPSEDSTDPDRTVLT